MKTYREAGILVNISRREQFQEPFSFKINAARSKYEVNTYCECIYSIETLIVSVSTV